jgi:hypothetical protein
MELSVPKGDFLSGQSVPLFIPSSARREWQINGDDNESRAEVETEFAQIRGYEFEWGQIIEELFDPAESGNDADSACIGACWHFVLIDVCNEFCDRGGNLGELSDLAVDILESIQLDALAELTPDQRSEVLPDYVTFDEGNNISVFEINVLGTENIERARMWVDSLFIPGVLPILTDRLRESNRAASSRNNSH